jgi:hypothetical protein
MMSRISLAFSGDAHNKTMYIVFQNAAQGFSKAAAKRCLERAEEKEAAFKTGAKSQR